MGKKIIALILVLVNVLTLASCMAPKESDPSNTDETDESGVSTTETRVNEAIERIATALAECNYDNFRKNSTSDCKTIEKAMPVVPEIADDDFTTPRPDKALIVKNMVISTLTYEVNEKSFKSGMWGSDCSVEVKFSYKDYNEVVGKRDVFLGPADFNTLLIDVEKTIDKSITLKFKKEGRHYLLDNPDDLVSLYYFEVPKLKYMNSIFDMVDKVYMVGDNWDPVKECYTDTNTIEMVLVLNERAKQYIWKYVYRFAEETKPKWTIIYTSQYIVDQYPTEIRVKYTQRDNIKTGFYAFYLIDPQTSNIYGMEFDVKNTETPAPTETSSTESTQST